MKKKKKKVKPENLAEKVRRENELKQYGRILSLRPSIEHRNKNCIKERRNIKMKLIPKIDLDNNDRKRNVWFISDLHYNHQNILKLNNRPFNNIEEMNQSILQDLKKIVKKDDILFDLGDMIWKENNDSIQLFKNILPERSYKLLGNHDSQNNLLIGGWGKAWKSVTDTLDVIIKYNGEDIQITMSHYPLLDWNHRFRGSWMIHGHTHGSLDKVNKESGELRLDIGYDSEISKEYESFIIPFEIIYEKMKKITERKTFRDWAREKFN